MLSQDTTKKKEQLDSSVSFSNTVSSVSDMKKEGSFVNPQPGPSGLQRTNQKDDKSATDINSASGNKNQSSGKGTVDLDVLMALPESLRNQVISEYEQQGYTIPCAAKSPVKVSHHVRNDGESSLSLSSKPASPGDKDISGTNSEDREDTYSRHRTSNYTESLESEDLITSFSQVRTKFVMKLYNLVDQKFQ